MALEGVVGALTLSLGKKRAPATWFIGYTKDGEADNG